MFAVADCVGGTTAESHKAGLERVIQAGAQPVSWISVLCELERDWARADTTDGMVRIAREHGGSWGVEIFIKNDPPFKAR